MSPPTDSSSKIRPDSYAERVPNSYRVVQWTTGNVGKSSLQAIATHPALELVGCYAWSQEKAGRDAGELCGMAPLGITASNDVEALLALKPDCVVYNPMWIDVDELVRILSAGVNVVTTAAFITGHNLGAGRDRILAACRHGGSTIFVSGVSPGFAELLAIVSAMVCNRIDKVIVNEAADTTFYDSPATERPVGFGQPIDHPQLQAMTAQGTAIFGGRSGWSPTRWGSNSTRSAVWPNTRRPPRTSTWVLGPLRRDVSRASTPAGREWRAAGPSSSSMSGGARDRPSIRTGRWTRMAGSSRSTELPRLQPKSALCRRPTSRPKRSPTSWCSGTS